MQTTLSQAWQTRLLTLGKIGFTILLAILLAQLFWQLVAPTPLYLAAPSRSSGATSMQTLSGSAQYHLFGELGTEPLTQVQEETAAPDTTLRLELLGITKGSVPERSSAIIAPKGAEGSFYRIGDIVQGGTRLAAVYDDRVVLDTNGKLENLKFAEEVRSGVNPVASSEPKTPPAGNLRERFAGVKTPSEFMTLLNEEGSQDPSGALRELGLEPIGEGQGYRVQAGSMLMALQLQPGDVVLSVNGQNLGNPQADQQLLQQVSSEGQARIEVQRGNSRFVINHSLN